MKYWIDYNSYSVRTVIPWEYCVSLEAAKKSVERKLYLTDSDYSSENEYYFACDLGDNVVYYKLTHIFDIAEYWDDEDSDFVYEIINNFYWDEIELEHMPNNFTNDRDWLLVSTKDWLLK